jgi:hypothetical protein
MRGDNYNTSRADYPREDSSNLLAFEVQQANQTFTGFLDRTIKALQNTIKHLEKNIFLEPNIPENVLEELFLNWNHILNRHRGAFDHREKVIEEQFHLMAYCLSNYSLNHSYVKYVTYAKEDAKLSGKQANKMVNLEINKVDTLFNPKNFMEARQVGFLGQQCDVCGSWRTQARWDNDAGRDRLWCFAIHKDKLIPQWGELRTMAIKQQHLIDSEDFEIIFNMIQTHDYTLDFDTREKLLEKLNATRLDKIREIEINA